MDLEIAGSGGVRFFHAKGGLGLEGRETGMSREFRWDVPDALGVFEELVQREFVLAFGPLNAATPHPNKRGLREHFSELFMQTLFLLLN